MVRTVHYVGMDQATYQRARRVWGGPAFKKCKHIKQVEDGFNGYGS